MTDSEIIKELNTLKKQLYEMQVSLGKHFDQCHKKSSADIGENENVIVDLEIRLAKLESKVGE